MSRQPMLRRTAVGMACVMALAGCASPGGMFKPMQENVPMVEGPAIEDIVTPFDRALSCLDGRLSNKLTFSVGAILDSTGKEQLSDGGVGKFVTQGAGDIVQSALFQAGTTVVNRRDPRIMETETRWGLYNAKTLIPSMFFITGSINSLDFIPGGGFEAQVAGIGPRYRQHRILVGLDLSLTDTKTGRIVANVPLQKQIVASEVGFGVGRFFGETLVSLDVGNQNREAVHFAMRQMLNLATFELLTQVMRPENYADCRAEIQAVHGVIGNTKTSRRVAQFLADREGVADAAPGAAAVPAVAARPVAPVVAPAASAAKPAPAAPRAPANGKPLTAAAPATAAAAAAVPAPAVPHRTAPAAAPVQPVVTVKEPAARPAAVVPVPVPLPVVAPDSAQKAEPVAVQPPPASVAPATSASPTNGNTPTQRVYFGDEQSAPSDKAVRALDIPVRSAEPVDPLIDTQPAKPVGATDDVRNDVSPGTPVATAVVPAAAPVETPAETTPAAVPAVSIPETAPAAPVAVVPAPAVVAEPVPVTPEPAKAEPVVEPAKAEPVVSAVVEPTPAQPSVPTVSEPAPEPAAVPASEVAAAPAPAAPQALGQAEDMSASALIPILTCETPKGSAKVVQAPKASRPGTQVYISGPADSTVCVFDASGKLWSHHFKQASGRAFNGTPPWNLQSPQLGNMQIFFQGWRITTPLEGVDRIKLVERPVQ